MSNHDDIHFDLLPERDQITENVNAFGYDVVEEEGKKIAKAIIRTSDRILFKRCRRRWAWQSHLRKNLGPKHRASPLWLGSGIHFALEDFHSTKLFPTAAAAFQGYVKASITQIRKKGVERLPEDLDELIILGTEMMEYYELWLTNRDPLQTYIHNGEPQVEVNFKIKVPWEPGTYGLDEVYYSGQIDRVIIDESGMLWLVEYKTAKAIQTSHYQTDPQVASYCWAASCIYDKPIAGVIYQQHRKTLPKDPRILQSGTVSTAQNQITSHRAYRQALLNVYRDIRLAPEANIRYLDELADAEQPRFDPFIRRDYIFRNQHQIEAEGAKIMMEIMDMLNPDLNLYPNPTRGCAFECPYISACVSLDDGSDFEYELDLTTVNRETEYDSWRKYLEVPQSPHNNPNQWLEDLVQQQAQLIAQLQEPQNQE